MALPSPIMVSWRGFMLCPRLGAGTAVGSVAVDFIVMANLRVVWIFSSLWDLLNLPDLGRPPAAGAPPP